MEFRVVNGSERFLVTDIQTGGERYDSTWKELMTSLALFHLLGHDAMVEDRKKKVLTIHNWNHEAAR